MNTYKQFKGPKSLEVIVAQCAAHGLVVQDSDGYLSDYVTIRKPAAPLACYYYCDFSGRFFGTNEDGVLFDSSKELDGEPWFDALLAFFYEPLPSVELPLNLGEIAFESGVSGGHPVPAGDGYNSKLHGAAQ